jgi:hypothetical protein
MDRLVVRSFWSTSGQCCKPHESERDSQRLVVTLEWLVHHSFCKSCVGLPEASVAS